MSGSSARIWMVGTLVLTACTATSKDIVFQENVNVGGVAGIAVDAKQRFV